MSDVDKVQLFEDKKVRTAWDEEKQEWFFSIVDSVEILADSKDPKQYIKKMRARDPELSAKWGTICTPVEMVAPDGKRRKTLAADLEGMFRIIQSIPSKKAEPFKQWMAQVAAERINQAIDPERSIDQAVADYRRLGYSEAWITRRIKTIEIRKGLTDEWKRGGVTKEVPNAKISVMGGEQAASVLATVKEDQYKYRGLEVPKDEIAQLKKEILAKYDYEGSAFYSTARLWDDGIIDPVDTRKILALGIAASLNQPFPPQQFGVFRM